MLVLMMAHLVYQQDYCSVYAVQ